MPQVPRTSVLPQLAPAVTDGTQCDLPILQHVLSLALSAHFILAVMADRRAGSDRYKPAQRKNVEAFSTEYARGVSITA